MEFDSHNMPRPQSTLRVRFPDSNLEHPDLVRLADSLGSGLRSLSGDVLNFVNENKLLYTTKELLENIKHPGKVLVNGGSALIDVQDFIILSSFLHSTERLMNTTLYKTHIATQVLAQESAAQDLPSAAAALDTEFVTNSATQTHSAKSRNRHRATKRLKTSHSSQDTSSIDVPLMEARDKPTKGKGRLLQPVPFSPKVSTVPNPFQPSSISGSTTPIKSEARPLITTTSDVAAASDENSTSTMTMSPDAKESPPTKRIRLEPMVLVDTAVTVAAASTDGGANAPKVNQDIASVRASAPRKLRSRKSLGRL
ncbi:hypothetical protein D9619_003778 [Psilocybe cf. subviscida]|uniref:Uncharacterized protein n=1 Tax=Psilocybe cf. subviscida TaxID=2480587 RepID=A0A8H5AWC5_9AGAR|nr:hypothetical protein D9619_003778 [Psilocybe cf. subviscida]